MPTVLPSRSGFLKAKSSLKQLAHHWLEHHFHSKQRVPPQLLPDEVLTRIVFYLPPTAKGRLRTVNSLFYEVIARYRYERVFVSFLADAGDNPLQTLRDIK
jgi:hypothetical protein